MRIIELLLSNKFKRHSNNSSILLGVSIYVIVYVLAARYCFSAEQPDNSAQFDITKYSHNSRKPLSSKKEIGNYGLKDLSGRLLLDRYVEITQGIQADKYVEFVGISTPTATLASGHADLWLNNTSKQLCTRFDDGSSSCLASASAVTGFLTASSATATYLSIGSAASTYLTPATAATTYGALNSTNTWTGGQSWASSRRSTFTVAPALLNLTSTVLATDANGVIVSTTISSSGGGITAASNTTWTGINTFNGITLIKGTTSNDLAQASYVGEVISTSIARASALLAGGSGVYTKIASVTLTAGDWDMSATSCGLINTVTGETFRIGLINSVAGDDASGTTEGQDLIFQGPTNTSAGDDCIVIPSYQILVAPATLTTYILKGYASYSGGTPKLFGYMRARRRR